MKKKNKKSSTTRFVANLAEQSEMIADWLEKNKDLIPTVIQEAILNQSQLILELNSKYKQVYQYLRQKFGDEPIKEREDKASLDKLDEKLQAQGEAGSVWDPNYLATLQQKLEKSKAKYRSLLTEYLAYKKARPPRKKRNSSARQEQGGQEIISTTEPVFSCPCLHQEIMIQDVLVPEERKPSIQEGVLVRSIDERTRYNLQLVVQEITYKVETLQNPITGVSATAVVDEGPAGFQVTWSAISQLIAFVVGAGIPIVRLGTMLAPNEGYFSPETIYRLLEYAAKGLASVYLEIASQVTECDILSTDDTNTRVLAMRQEEICKNESSENFLQNKAQFDKERQQKAYTSLQEEDPQKADFVTEIQFFLGGQRELKNNSGLKKAVYTTVVIARNKTLPHHPEIVLYYTERKTAGDLLESLFAIKEKKEKYLQNPLGKKENQSSNIETKPRKILLQSDLSANNLPKSLPPGVQLEQLGCGSHARRPFWRKREEDQAIVSSYCYSLLLLFDQIFDSDRDARAGGDASVILEHRQQEQKPKWEKILEICKEIKTEFAPNTAFYGAAAYCTEHYQQLTRYLTDPYLLPDNNLAERLLRYEKIMLDNSHFRKSLKGRLVYDILRTIITTCNAQRISFSDYVEHVLRHQVDARQNPEKYTPQVFRQSLEKTRFHKKE